MHSLIEEKGLYQIDCSNVLWASDIQHEIYHKNTASILSDVDWVIETNDKIILIEYKNGTVDARSRFNPCDLKKIQSVAKKYYDTLHFLNLMNKTKPKYYYYVLEYPNDDKITRGIIREKITGLLPFRMQKLFDNNVRLIEGFYVVSINEWNEIFPDCRITRIQ